ncbi:MAG: hypothetical protein ACKV0T_23060 [Planctomycetales bacterium]
MQTKMPVFASGLCVLVMWQVSIAQGQVLVRRNWAPYHVGATALSTQILATAEYVRASGEATRNAAEAREIRARAVRQEIVNSKEWVKAYFERREINEAERLKKFISQHDRLELQHAKTWELLRDDPEVTGPMIINGEALNFLLNRLSGSVLAYQFSMNPAANDLENNEFLRLDPQTVAGLQVQRDLPNGRRLVFRLAKGVATDVENWPYALSGEEFLTQRQAYNEARAQVILVARNGGETRPAAAKLSRAYDALDAAYWKVNGRESRLKGAAKSAEYWHQHCRAQRFLKSLAGEVAQLQEAGGTLAEDGLSFRGAHLIALLTHMSRNGLEFAPAADSDTAAYHQVFRRMRDLYVNIADAAGQSKRSEAGAK